MSVKYGKQVGQTKDLEKSSYELKRKNQPSTVIRNQVKRVLQGEDKSCLLDQEDKADNRPLDLGNTDNITVHDSSHFMNGEN